MVIILEFAMFSFFFDVLLFYGVPEFISAVVFILASVRAPESVKELMTHQLHHADVAHRSSAILRFSVLWRFRYQVWPRMEEGAHIHFKVYLYTGACILCKES